MSIWVVLILAVVQGLAELLPVSSSAHVVVAEKLMGLNPSNPEMTFLLVMLHTGTMFAVIVYFWKAWRKRFFPSMEVFIYQAVLLILASALTAMVGYPLMKVIEHVAGPNVEIEDLFGNLQMISIALAAAGVLIIWAGLSKAGLRGSDKEVGVKEAGWIGAVQGLCLPFRGFSRSGATISTGLLLGSAKARVEEFSFALAVILTPAAIGKEAWRLLKNAKAGTDGVDYKQLFLPGGIGLVLSFLAGLVALLFLSKVLEKGRWHLFGFYCLGAAVLVYVYYLKGAPTLFTL